MLNRKGTTMQQQPIANLPHCWVCGVRFSDQKPPGPANREEHHIIPRQAGGSDGPQVSLCDVHHTKLHKIALRLSSSKPHFDLLIGEPDAAKHKLLWLASRVFTAFEVMKNDPNKKVMVLISIDRQKQLMIDRLKKVYPKAKSRESIYDLALTSLYQRHFTQT
jgi:hypothetical protein